MQKEELKGISILTGTIIGAGILGIPYVIAQSGFLSGLLLLIGLALAVTIVNLYMGEVILRTKMNHELTGYAEKYIGKTGKFLLSISMVSIVLGALLAYLIGEGEIINSLFPVFSSTFYTILFFILVSIILFFGLEAIATSELFLGFIMLAFIALIITFSLGNIDVTNLTHFSNSLPVFFFPFGVILFAYLGVESLPEVAVELANKKKSIKKVIIYGSLIPLILYVVFTFAVVGVTGVNTTEIATIGLGQTIGTSVLILGNLFAIVAMATSYLALGLALIWMLHLDYNMNKKLSWLIISIIPLTLFLLGAKNFIQTIGFVGAIAGGIQSIIIILMFYQAKKYGERKPEYEIKKSTIIGFILVTIFLLGIFYQFF